MKKYLFITTLAGSLMTSVLFAQKGSIPKAVKDAFAQKFPAARHVEWEAEEDNYEANWGGKSGEDSSALFTPGGQFLEFAKAIPAGQLPAAAQKYIKSHYPKASIREAALITGAKGKITYEAEVEHKDLVFDEHGNYLKTEKD